MTISQDFIDAVENGKDINVKIMLSQSLVMDPTFQKFNKMISYAKKSIPELIDIHDGEYLELDKANWNKDYMNEQLTKVIDNFSNERITHLKNICAEIYKDKIKNDEAKNNSNFEKKPNSCEYHEIAKIAVAGGVLVAAAGAVLLKPAVVVTGVVISLAGGAVMVTNK